MGQVYDIPYSALIATLLLKNRVVTFDEIGDFNRKIYNISDYNCCVIDDLYANNLPYSSDDLVSMFLSIGDNYICIRSDLDYDSKIGKLTVREILEKTAEYPGNVLLDYIGYQKKQNDNIDMFKHKNKKVLSRNKVKLSDFYNKGHGVKVGV